MIGAIVAQLIGLFVDDEFLAAAILGAVALVSALALTAAAPAWVVGLLLTLALPAALAASVVRSARRATPGITPRGSRAREERQEERMTRRFIDISAPLQNDVQRTRQGLVPRSSTSITSRACRKSCHSFRASGRRTCRKGRGGRSNAFNFRPTTAPISTRRGITTRR